MDRATSMMEAEMHFMDFPWGTGVVRYSMSVSAPGVDRHNVDTILGGLLLKHLFSLHPQ
jgi:hypothetical protein